MIVAGSLLLKHRLVPAASRKTFVDRQLRTLANVMHIRRAVRSPLRLLRHPSHQPIRRKITVLDRIVRIEGNP